MATDSTNSTNCRGATPDNITLRVITLAHGNTAENDLYLVLDLDTTIAQLKSRIQEGLSQHPAPEVQRLIYQGRPLIDANTTLRQVLRINQSNDSPSYIIHLVIRDPQLSNAPPAPARAAPALPQPGTLPPQAVPPPHMAGLPLMMGQDVHNRIHNQLHQMQHHLHHQHALRASQVRLGAQQAIHNVQPAMPTQARVAGHPLPPIHSPGMAPLPLGMQHPAMPPITTLNGQPGAMPSPQHTGFATRIEERGPNGEHRTINIDNNGTTTRATSTTMTFRVSGLTAPDPTDRPSSAPGSSPPTTSDPINRPANAVPINIQVNAQPPPMPAAFPFPGGMQLPFAFPGPSLFNPAMLNHAHAAPQPSQAQTTAWLLNSAQGPQGIVFAPGHGLFTTLPPFHPLDSQILGAETQFRPTPTAPARNMQIVQRLPQLQAQLIDRQPDGHVELRPPGELAPPQPGARPQPPGQLRPALPVARPARLQGIENNDLLQFVIGRGWLFLRLYMFIFVLSESGTWRRMFMLTSAIIFCLLPRNNPLADVFNRVRRHFDNLIGPPNIPQRQAQHQGHGQARPGQQPSQQNAPSVDAGPNPPTTATATHLQAAMPTPEEAARRLIEQQNRRNPNPLLHALYRIEQGLALFFASLIPGLGERHVQAREQARRVLEEEERRTNEERQRQQQSSQDRQQGNVDAAPTGQAEKAENQEAGPLPESWASPTPGESTGGAASSSGIDRGQEDAGVRLRESGA